MDTDSHVERVTARNLGDVLVGTDTSSFQRFGRKLFKLVGDKVDAEREVVDGSSLSTKIIDTDLSIGDTTIVSGLGERLVLAVSVTSSGTTGHFDYKKRES